MLMNLLNNVLDRGCQWDRKTNLQPAIRKDALYINCNWQEII